LTTMDSTALIIGAGVLIFALAGKGKGASSIASKLAADITKRKYDYARETCRSFQKSVGLPVDGIYGPSTAAALAKVLGKAPKALFKGAAKKAKPVTATKA
jgi:murein L,D-transpeptidase YcbB/YkuD